MHGLPASGPTEQLLSGVGHELERSTIVLLAIAGVPETWRVKNVYPGVASISLSFLNSLCEDIYIRRVYHPVV